MTVCALSLTCMRFSWADKLFSYGLVVSLNNAMSTETDKKPFPVSVHQAVT